MQAMLATAPAWCEELPSAIQDVRHDVGSCSINRLQALQQSLQQSLPHGVDAAISRVDAASLRSLALGNHAR